jgi:membrane protease YdiL (CAAX protease family)
MLSKKPWQPELVLMFIAALMMSFCFAAIATLLLQNRGLAGFKNPDDFGFLLLGTLSIQGATWIIIWFFLKASEVSWREAFGLNQPKLVKIILFAVGVLLFALPVVWSLQSFSIQLLAKLGVPPENQRAVEMFLTAKSIWARGYFAVFAIVIAPVAEEFIFRGLLYPFVKQMGSPKLAFFGVSAIFAEIHFDAGTLVPLFVLALVLTWLYEKTNCLLASITAHSLFNSINLVALYFMPQLNAWIGKISQGAHPA